MSRVRPPADFEIAALRKKQEVYVDPMKPGSGTPWEDRGSHGLVGAYFKTVSQSLFKPVALISMPT